MGESHTPGPWRVEYEPYCHVRADAGCVLAADYTTEANARLIASAPDLLEALTFMREILDEAALRVSYEPGSLGAIELAEAYAKAEAAIAKAAGATP